MADVILTSFKTCKQCGALFGGVRCKACKSASDAAYRLNNPIKLKELRASYHLENKESLNAKAKISRLKNKDRDRAYGKAWRAANKEVRAVKVAAYKAANKDKIKAYTILNADKVREQQRANPEPQRIREHKRRAQKRLSPGSLSKGITDKLFKLQKGRCACCGELLGVNYHMDHIMPLALGGSNTDDNIQLLRAICNHQKHAKHPIDFMQSRGFLL